MNCIATLCNLSCVLYLELLLVCGKNAIRPACFRRRQSQPSSNSTHDEQLNSSPVRTRTALPPRIRPFNQDSVPDRSRCVFCISVPINNVLMFMLYFILFAFQRQVSNVPEHPVHGQVASVTRISKLIILKWILKKWVSEGVNWVFWLWRVTKGGLL
jgi:hypothetical protein